jgi:UDP-glucose 4-epimerase
MMRIAITGVSGYLGQLLVRRLQAEGVGGDDVLGIDLAGSPHPPSVHRYLRRDVRDPRIARDLEGYDTVVHLAFIVETMRDRKLMYDINLGGSRNLLTACERVGVENLVVASSVAAYGVQGDRVITEATPLLGDARSFYAHTKRLVEEELDVFEERNPGVRVARLRPSVVLGPRCNTWALAALGNAGRLDTPRGMRTPIVHEDDVAEAMWLAISKPVRGPLLVALREPMGAADIGRLSGVRPRVLPESVIGALAQGAFALGRTRMNGDWLVLSMNNGYRCDPSHTERQLGWAARHSAEEAVAAVLSNLHRLRARGAPLLSPVDRVEGTRIQL